MSVTVVVHDVSAVSLLTFVSHACSQYINVRIVINSHDKEVVDLGAIFDAQTEAQWFLHLH